MDHVSSHVLVGSRMSKIFDFCGSEIPPSVMSAKNILTLDYVVKSIGGIRESMPEEDYGFVIEYKFLTDWGDQPKEAIRDTTKCKFYIMASRSFMKMLQLVHLPSTLLFNKSVISGPPTIQDSTPGI